MSFLGLEEHEYGGISLGEVCCVNLPAVTSAGTAAVEVAVGTGTRAGHATLGGATDVDFRNSGGERGLGGRRGLHGSGRGGLAGGLGARERLEACSGVAVIDCCATPSILAACEGCQRGCSCWWVSRKEKTHSTRFEHTLHCHSRDRSFQQRRQRQGRREQES